MAAVNTELRARDVMSGEPVCVDPSASIQELARVLMDNEISGVPVTDAQGRVIGVASKSDLIRNCSDGSNGISPAFLFELLSEEEDEGEDGELMTDTLVCVEDVMTEDPLVVSPESSLVDIARSMHEARMHRVIVVDGERFPLGVITSLDLIGALSR
ncbi:MAG: CBS domain-containing protein [Planctomycetota bacterium]|jgi:CBS domain-containing protein